MSPIVTIVLLVWFVVASVQMFLAIVTAFRRTKTEDGDVFRFAWWLMVFVFAALIPGLGYYYWEKNRETVSIGGKNDLL